MLLLLRLETEIKLEPFEARSRSLPFVRDYYSTLLPGWYTQTHTYFAQAHIHTHTHTLSARHSLGRRRSRIRLWRDNSARKHYFDYTAFCCCSSSSTYFTFLFPFCFLSYLLRGFFLHFFLLLLLDSPSSQARWDDDDLADLDHYTFLMLLLLLTPIDLFSCANG